MTKQEIYNTVVQLTDQLRVTGIGEKLFEAARTGRGERVKAEVNAFQAKYATLYHRITNFVDDFNHLIEKSETGLDGEIFALREDPEKGWRVFNLDTASYFALTFLTGWDDCHLWCDEYRRFPGEVSDAYTGYLEALEDVSQSPYLTEFLDIGSFTQEELECLEEQGYIYKDTCELLADIFAGELEDYCN